MGIKKSLIIFSTTLILAPIVSSTTLSSKAFAEEKIPPTEQTISKSEVENLGINPYYSFINKSFTNKELFDELEKQGYDLQDIFTEEEIQQALAEDRLRAGQTRVVNTGTYTWTLYLSSAYTKVISALGQGATTIIGGLIGAGLGAAAFGSFLGSLASSNIDTDRGIYINFENQTIPGSQPMAVPVGWGYQ